MANTFLNRNGVKRRALDRIQQLRPAWGATRISEEFYEWLDGMVTNAIDSRIRQAPSIGKTLK